MRPCRVVSQPETVRLRRPAGPLHASLRAPGSKSLSNRALLLAALAEGCTRIENCLDADDTRLMIACLERLGYVPRRLDGALLIDGNARLGLLGGDIELEVGTAGTVARFLTAALAAVAGPRWTSVRVDGSARMRERPMEGLLEALEQLGGRFEWLGVTGALPLRVLAGGGLAGGTIVLERPASSQFVSALLIAGCLGRKPLDIVLREGTPSRPYVDMTIAVIEAFGGVATWRVDGRELWVEPRPLRASARYVIEPDASAASYLLALPVIWGGAITVADLGADSLQGDAAFVHVLERFGAEVARSRDATSAGRAPGTRLRGIDVDLTDMPDVALTAAVVALFCEGPTSLRGVEILRHHESDRLHAAATELRKLGAEVIERADGLDITPPRGGPKPGVTVDTYLDHRMAMAFSLVGDVEIADPRCVDKTFPAFFEVLAGLGMVAS